MMAKFQLTSAPKPTPDTLLATSVHNFEDFAIESRLYRRQVAHGVLYRITVQFRRGEVRKINGNLSASEPDIYFRANDIVNKALYDKLTGRSYDAGTVYSTVANDLEQIGIRLIAVAAKNTPEHVPDHVSDQGPERMAEHARGRAARNVPEDNSEHVFDPARDRTYGRAARYAPEQVSAHVPDSDSWD